MQVRIDSVTDQGVLPLFNSLENTNCKLNKLDLSNTNITDKGVQFMRKDLNYENCKLIQLNLVRNSLADQGALCLTEVSIMHLDLLNCLVNCKLTDLDLSDTITRDLDKFITLA